MPNGEMTANDISIAILFIVATRHCFIRSTAYTWVLGATTYCCRFRPYSYLPKYNAYLTSVRINYSLTLSEYMEALKH